MSEAIETGSIELSDEVIAESMGLPFYTRLAITGLLVIVATMVLIAIVQLGSGDSSGVPFIIINVAIALIVAGLIWRFGSWALVLGAIAGLLGTVLLYGSYLIESTSNVNSVFDFGVAVVATVGSLMALIGSIVAFVQRLKGTARTESKPAERNVLWAVTGVVAVIVVISAIATLAARDMVDEAERAGATEVLIKTTEFKTTKLDAKAGETLRLVIKNDDLYVHTFTIDDLAVDTTVGPRGERALSLTPAKPGEYEYTCTVPGHESMKGTLTVS